jgi:hypothetical protein
MPRSERGRIRGNCLDGIALLSLAQAPVAGAEPLPLVERLAMVARLWRRAARRAGAGRATAGRVGRTIESRQRGSKNRGEGMGERQGRAGRRLVPGRSAPPGARQPARAEALAQAVYRNC